MLTWLQVNWPKLNPLSYATDGIVETYSRVKKDPMLGPLIKGPGHERGPSNIRLVYAEEGKKRVD